MAKGIDVIRRAIGGGGVNNEKRFNRVTSGDDVRFAYFLFLSRNASEKDIDEKSEYLFNTVLTSILSSKEFGDKIGRDFGYPKQLVQASPQVIARYTSWLNENFNFSIDVETVQDAGNRAVHLGSVCNDLLELTASGSDEVDLDDDQLFLLKKVALYADSREYINDPVRGKQLFGALRGSILTSLIQKDFKKSYELSFIEGRDFLENVTRACRSCKLDGTNVDTKFRFILFDAADFLGRLLESEDLTASAEYAVRALLNTISNASDDQNAGLFRIRYVQDGDALGVQLFHPESVGRVPTLQLTALSDDGSPFLFELTIPEDVLRMDDRISRFAQPFDSSALPMGTEFLFWSVENDPAPKLVLLEGARRSASVATVENQPQMDVIYDNSGVLGFAIENLPSIRPYRVVVSGNTVSPGFVSDPIDDLNAFGLSSDLSSDFGFKVYLFDVAGFSGNVTLYNLDGLQSWTGDIDASQHEFAILSTPANVNFQSLSVEGCYVDLASANAASSVKISDDTYVRIYARGETKGKIDSVDGTIFDLFDNPAYSIRIPKEIVNSKFPALLKVENSSGSSFEQPVSVDLTEAALDACVNHGFNSRDQKLIDEALSLGTSAGFLSWTMDILENPRLNWENKKKCAFLLKQVSAGTSTNTEVLSSALDNLWREERDSREFFKQLMISVSELAPKMENSFEGRVFQSTPLKELALDGVISEKRHFESHPDNSKHSVGLLRSFERSSLLANHLANLASRHKGNRVIYYERARYEAKQGYSQKANFLASTAVKKKKDYKEPQLLKSEALGGEDHRLKTFALKTNMKGLSILEDGEGPSVHEGRAALALGLHHFPRVAAETHQHGELLDLCDVQDNLSVSAIDETTTFTVIFASGTYDAAKSFETFYNEQKPNCLAVFQTQSKWINEAAFLGDWVFVFHNKYKVSQSNLQVILNEVRNYVGLVRIYTAKYEDSGVKLREIGFLVKATDIEGMERCEAKNASKILEQSLTTIKVLVKEER